MGLNGVPQGPGGAGLCGSLGILRRSHAGALTPRPDLARASASSRESPCTGDGSRMYAIKTEVTVLKAASFTFREQETMYGGSRRACRSPFVARRSRSAAWVGASSSPSPTGATVGPRRNSTSSFIVKRPTRSSASLTEKPPSSAGSSGAGNRSRLGFLEWAPLWRRLPVGACSASPLTRNVGVGTLLPRNDQGPTIARRGASPSGSHTCAAHGSIPCDPAKRQHSRDASAHRDLPRGGRPPGSPGRRSRAARCPGANAFGLARHRVPDPHSLPRGGTRGRAEAAARQRAV